MKKYVYARENLKLLALLGIIVGLPLLLFSIYLIMVDRGGAMGYCMLAISIILFIILLVFAITRIKWRNWHNKIEKLGTKTHGTVMDFGYSYTSGNLHPDPPTADSEEYWLEVAYVDSSGNPKVFKTPELSFAPEERKDITCDVYIYKNEVLATNFVNLNKKKIDFQEIFYCILMGIIFIGTCALFAWLKK